MTLRLNARCLSVCYHAIWTQLVTLANVPWSARRHQTLSNRMNANRSSFNSSLAQELCFLTFLRCMIYQDLVVQRKLQILPLNKLLIRSPLNSFYQVKYQGISRGPAGINLSLITVSYTNLQTQLLSRIQHCMWQTIITHWHTLVQDIMYVS